MTTTTSLSPNTLLAYEGWERRFRAYLQGKEPTLKSATAFLQYLADQGIKQNSIYQAAYALRRNLELRVPVPKFNMPEPDYLTTEQVNLLIDHSPTILERTLFIVLFDTACRISEVLQLRVSDLRLPDNVAIMIRKGGHRQEVSLGQESVRALREWLRQRKSQDDLVFMDNRYHNVRYLLGRVAKKLDIRFHPHLLRHTRARQLYDSGVPLERVSEILGHRRLDTTMKIYARLRAEDRAALMDKVAPWRKVG